MGHNADKDIEELLKSIALTKQGIAPPCSRSPCSRKRNKFQSSQITLAHASNREACIRSSMAAPLYARCTKSPSAELDVLKKREPDDAFITNLRETESRLKLRQTALEHQPTFNPHRVDGAIIPPSDPVAPRKGFALAFAAIAGLIIGLIAAGIAEMPDTPQREFESPTRLLIR